MASISISRAFQQSTCTLTVEGHAAQPNDWSTLSGNLRCSLDLPGSKPKQLEGDLSLLQDLSAVLERYARSLLSGQPQGTFSGTVAIRPLAYVTHRMTVRQGSGIGQADLSATQLYDLTEALAELRESLPQLADLTLPRPKSWYAQPTGIAALVVGGVGVAAAIAVLSLSGGEAELRQEATSELSDAGIALSEGTAPAPAAPPNARRGALPEGDPSNTDAATSGLSAAAPSEPAEDAAAESEAQLARAESGDRLATLLAEWESAWEAPADLDVAISYTVVVQS
ncbi:MAG: DUF4335 domain-containing protein, partial [Cyanobacteria bacterium J06639_1]